MKPWLVMKTLKTFFYFATRIFHQIDRIEIFTIPERFLKRATFLTFKFFALGTSYFYHFIYLTVITWHEVFCTMFKVVFIRSQESFFTASSKHQVFFPCCRCETTYFLTSCFNLLWMEENQFESIQWDRTFLKVLNSLNTIFWPLRHFHENI